MGADPISMAAISAAVPELIPEVAPLAIPELSPILEPLLPSLSAPLLGNVMEPALTAPALSSIGSFGKSPMAGFMEGMGKFGKVAGTANMGAGLLGGGQQNPAPGAPMQRPQQPQQESLVGLSNKITGVVPPSAGLDFNSMALQMGMSPDQLRMMLMQRMR